MLVLTRKLNQPIVIGDPAFMENLDKADALIEVMVVEIHGDQVRIGINAPGMWSWTEKKSG